MCETIDEGNAIESGTRLCEDVSLCFRVCENGGKSMVNRREEEDEW